MKQLSSDFVTAIANTAWRQIKASASADTIGSWGISELYAQEISVKTDIGRTAMPALVMRVQGFSHKGYVLVALDEGKDLYRIYTAKAEDSELYEYMSEAYCDMLADCLDKCIERGEMTDAEYEQRIRETYFMHLV